MGVCATQVFDQITRDQFNCLLARANEAGIMIQGDAGQATHSGVTIKWQFTEADQRLELQCLHTPLFVTCGMVNDKIHQLVDACQAPPVA
jgi:hypothetical protein